MSFDVIVIGAGAGGLAAAYKLVAAGKRVLVIEKGRTVAAADNISRPDLLLSGFGHRCAETWLDAGGRPFLPNEYSNVGGKTKWYGAALLRMSPREFEPEPSYGALGWPVSYKEFAKHYAESESIFSPRHFSLEPNLQHVIADICRNGQWTCELLSMALKEDIIHDQRHAKYFDVNASAAGYKNDAENVFLSIIRDAPNFKMITELEVEDLIYDGKRPSRVRGVICSDGSSWQAQAVIVAAGAMRSPLLLQKSLLRAGVTGSPLIGAFFKKHLMSTVILLSSKINHDVMRKTAMFLNSKFPHTTVQCLGWFEPERLARRLPNVFPRALASWIAARCTLFVAITEDGSHEANAVRWSDQGQPVLDYDVKRLPHAEREHREAVRSFCRQWWANGRFALARSVGIDGTGHAVGTLAAGPDPVSSVVDACGQVYGLQGLYVADGSALPRSGRSTRRSRSMRGGCVSASCLPPLFPTALFPTAPKLLEHGARQEHACALKKAGEPADPGAYRSQCRRPYVRLRSQSSNSAGRRVPRGITNAAPPNGSGGVAPAPSRPAS
jgi:choline dehydrogenase-like flavoprotein